MSVKGDLRRGNVVQTNKKKLLDYARQQSVRLENIRKNAQSAYKNAQAAKEQKDTEKAIQWMNRAHRLTRDNPNIIFDLSMLYLKTKAYDKAYALLQPLMRKFDFYEGWIALAILFSVRKSFNSLVQVLQHVLSCYCPTQDSWSLLTDLLRQPQDQVGCCAVMGTLNQLWIENSSGFPVRIYFDGQLSLVTSQHVITMPSDWQDYKMIQVESDGKPLIGSPIDLQRINRIEGFVQIEKDRASGWLWYPAEPGRNPDLTVEDQDGKKYVTCNVSESMEVVSLDVPLFRARKFSIPVSELPLEKLFFKDGLGRNLLGSPLDIPQEREISSFLKKKNPAALLGKGKGRQKEAARFLIRASFRGKNPVTSLQPALGVVVIIPVYTGRQETLTCIDSVLKTVPGEVIIQLVDDASPDQELIQALSGFVDGNRVFCIHHQENRGFPSAVNSGMAAWPGYDVILLNSDTQVCKGWLEKLQHAAYGEKDIGTVTPFSNHASIYSYPYHDKENPFLSEDEIRDLAMFFGTVHVGKTVEIPTAHGFCMFIRHDCLQHTGLFNADLFAQGYGEENDFSMRARHLGWKHVLALDVFVGHRGSVSFKENGKFLMKRNMRILNELYPGYDRFIHEYMQRQPLLPFWRAIDMARLKRRDEFQRKQGGGCVSYVLLITHQQGGGVERAVQERSTSLRLKGKVPIVVRPTVLKDGCQLEVQFRSLSGTRDSLEWLFPNLVFHFPEDEKNLWNFLRELQIDSVEVHHLHEHHEFLSRLIHQIGVPCDIYIHDYLFFCPRTVLLDKSKKYCGDPNDLRICQDCVDACSGKDDVPVNMKDWLSFSENQLMQARYVYVPSDDAFKRMIRHFPDLKQIRICNLEDDRADLSLEQLAYFSREYSHKGEKVHGTRHGGMRRYRIGLIGAIGISKGFRVIQALLRDADKRDLPLEFVMVGRSADDQVLMRSGRIFITGEYREEEAVPLVMEQDMDLAFFASIWPETWCYALSIAWRAGLRTVAYDMGAIAERIKKTDRGIVMPLNLSIAKQNDFLLKECKNIIS